MSTRGSRTWKSTGATRLPYWDVAANEAWLNTTLIGVTLLAWTQLIGFDGELLKADPVTPHPGNHGETLDVGRSTRRWSVAQRRAVTHRDAHCTFPNCDRPPSHCDIHHCQPWEDGGDTAITNGTLLCRHHHSFIHKRQWTVHLDHHQHAIYTKPDGTSHQPLSRRLCYVAVP